MDTKRKYRIFIVIAVFIVYTLIAAEPIPVETVLSMRWIKSLESTFPQNPESSLQSLIPYKLGSRFGYVSDTGSFAINQIIKNDISFSQDLFAEYSGIDEKIDVKNPLNEIIFTMNDMHAYPFFIADRIFIVHKEQSAVSELNKNGEILWSYFFSSILTCADAQADFFLCGTLDGTLFLIGKNGNLVYSYEPSGSRIQGIYGCAISKDGTKFAVISGIDEQRFVFFEDAAGSWRIRSHEFLGEGFRQPVFITFTDSGKRVAYERKGAVGIYEIESRNFFSVPVKDKIEYICSSDDEDLLFLINRGQARQKTFSVIKYPQILIIDAPYTNKDSFLAVNGKTIFLGGDNNLSMFSIDSR
ncbi:MAG: hypothetical protein Ta2B_24280 [Termitinemataceae bacterium]|nr:MAG: hypothetical protein Ta2B_24280 [Termitinemataceae bacterium]